MNEKSIDKNHENESISKHEYSVEDARYTLDHVVGFVSNCDSKAAIMLGVFGVILSIIATDSTISKLHLIFRDAANSGTVLSKIFLMLLFIAVVVFTFGILSLVSVLLAKTGTSKNDSKIYFSDIAANKDHTIYKEKVLNQLKCDVINDLVTEIYINSVICDKKFRRYNRGFKCTIIGTGLFLVLINCILVFTKVGSINGKL